MGENCTKPHKVARFYFSGGGNPERIPQIRDVVWVRSYSQTVNLRLVHITQPMGRDLTLNTPTHSWSILLCPITIITNKQ
jgi:hypothetical protein